VESDQDMRFGFEDEDGLSVLAQQIALTMVQLQQAGDAETETAAAAARASPAGTRLPIRFYPANQSIS
jgi:hypothetical protein